MTIDDPSAEREIFSEERSLTFVDHNAVVNVLFKLTSIRFPTPGRYGFFLFVDDDLVAERFLRVYAVQP